MKLIKVKNGLLESDNFFLASPFSDFAGEANINRNIATGKLNLISNNKIERLFNYNEFVIEVEKENFDTLGRDDYSMLYLSDGVYSFGIKEDITTSQNKYWKILRQDNHLQAYSSEDGVSYTNIGGMEFTNALTKQGFLKYSDKPFVLDSYRLYSNPYITLQNFPPDTICELYDIGNNLIKTRVFDIDMECKVYLDSNNFQGYFIFKDPLNNILFTSENIVMSYGDTWIISPYNFEILYLGSIVTDINPAMLQDLEEIIVIKNIGDKDYIDVEIGTQTISADLIELSLDGITYSNTLIINIAQNEEKQMFIRITKNVSSRNFKIRDFQIIISE